MGILFVMVWKDPANPSSQSYEVTMADLDDSCDEDEIPPIFVARMMIRGNAVWLYRRSRLPDDYLIGTSNKTELSCLTFTYTIETMRQTRELVL